MIYCSLDEAWGKKNNNYENENFRNIKKKNIKKKKIIENFTESIKERKSLSDIDCKKIMKHIMKCPKCYKKLREKFRPKILCLLKDIVEEYKEMIVLILIGIFIILFFNLISNINKN